MPYEPPDSQLRASDADREATAERLRTAAVEGRIDSTELEARLAAAYGARWCSELERLTLDVTPPATVTAPPVPARPVFVRPTRGTSGFAITSLVAGIVWAFWLGSVLAVVFGHVALREIKRSGYAIGGRGLAIAGLCLGYTQLVLLFIVAVFDTG